MTMRDNIPTCRRALDTPPPAGAKEFAAIALLLLLTACGGGSKAPERYTLTATPVTAGCRSAASIKIYEPDAAPGLDSWRIVVIDKPNHMTRYKGIAWAANTTRLVQQYLADSLEQSGLFASVSSDADTLPATYQLESKLRAFQVDLTGGKPRVLVRLSATLTQDDVAVKTMNFTRQADASGADMQRIVAIFGEQMHSISQEMAAKLAKNTGCHG
jgi:cholesterol transport system auxiliary component